MTPPPPQVERHEFQEILLHGMEKVQRHYPYARFYCATGYADPENRGALGADDVAAAEIFCWYPQNKTVSIEYALGAFGDPQIRRDAPSFSRVERDIRRQERREAHAVALPLEIEAAIVEWLIAHGFDDARARLEALGGLGPYLLDALQPTRREKQRLREDVDDTARQLAHDMAQKKEIIELQSIRLPLKQALEHLYRPFPDPRRPEAHPHYADGRFARRAAEAFEDPDRRRFLTVTLDQPRQAQVIEPRYVLNVPALHGHVCVGAHTGQVWKESFV